MLGSFGLMGLSTLKTGSEMRFKSCFWMMDLTILRKYISSVLFYILVLQRSILTLSASCMIPQNLFSKPFMVKISLFLW